MTKPLKIGNPIRDPGSAMVRCGRHCEGIANKPEKGILPRCLILESERREGRGSVIVGINPSAPTFSFRPPTATLAFLLYTARKASSSLPPLLAARAPDSSSVPTDPTLTYLASPGLSSRTSSEKYNSISILNVIVGFDPTSRARPRCLSSLVWVTGACYT